MVNLDGVCLQFIQAYISYVLKIFFFFFEKFYHGGTQIYQISAQG